jgi:predicted nucleotidyltransferase
MSAGQMKVRLPKDKIADFCRRHYIRKLAVFGSVLHGDARPDSDLDALVEFDPGHVPGLAFFGSVLIWTPSVQVQAFRSSN